VTLPGGFQTEYDPTRMLVQTHVPKSGGNSFRSSLERAIDKRAFVMWDRSTFGAFDDWESVLAEKRAEMLGIPGGFTEMPSAPAALCGHVSATTTFEQYPNAQHILLLREPRSRLLSHWGYVRSRTPEHLAGWGTWGRALSEATRSLEQFLADDRLLATTDNVATRMLLWRHPLIADDRRIDSAADETLLPELAAMPERYAFLNVVENRSWEAEFNTWLGLPFESIRENETPPSRPGESIRLADHLTPHVMEMMARATRFDAAIWHQVAALVLPGVSTAALADAVFAATVAKHAVLLAG
jgi:hypothetical protein